MFQDIDRLIEFGVQMGAIVTLIGILAAWLKRSVNRGMVTAEDFEKAIHDAKKSAREYTDKEIVDYKSYADEKDAADKKWLGTIQDKVEQNMKEVAELRGKVS